MEREDKASKIRGLLWLILYTAITVATTLSVKERYFTQKYAYIQFDSLIQRVRDDISEVKDPQMVESEMISFRSKLQATIKSHEQHYIIFISEKPVIGAKNLTDVIYQQVRK